jgi:hypothetical protein
MPEASFIFPVVAWSAKVSLLVSRYLLVADSCLCLGRCINWRRSSQHQQIHDPTQWLYLSLKASNQKNLLGMHQILKDVFSQRRLVLTRSTTMQHCISEK